MDDIILIAGSEDDLQKILNTINEGSNEYGLKINVAKTKIMIVIKSNK